MTKITIDRAIVEQALEVLESLQGGCTDSDDGTVEAVTVWCPEVISALRSALAEPVQDWDKIEALRESLREHMAEIHRLRAELADHSGDATEMDQEIEAAMADQVTHGLGITLGGKRIDPASIYKLYNGPAKSESEGHAAQVVYQISMKDGAASSAWVDVDEAAYRSAKLYGEYKCRCLYPAPPQRKPLTDEAHVLRSLLGASLGALRYHTEQTRPIQRTTETIAAIEHALTTHNIKVNTLSNHMVRPADQPSQRKPLTDEEIHDCFQQRGKTKAETRRLITRAIERAHGIGASNE